jgi:hypothetical protein
MATVVHNNACNSTTGFVPSTLLVGWEPTLAPPQKQPSSNLAASRSVECSDGTAPWPPKH